MQIMSPSAKAFREQYVTVDDVLDKMHLYMKQKHEMLERRSAGIKKIIVSHVEQKLYAWNVLITDNKGEYEPIVLEGQFPLKRIYGNVYNAHFDVPRGGAVELIVHWMGGHVMLACPGRPWKVHCQIGKEKNELS